MAGQKGILFMILYPQFCRGVDLQTAQVTWTVYYNDVK